MGWLREVFFLLFLYLRVYFFEEFQLDLTLPFVRAPNSFEVEAVRLHLDGGIFAVLEAHGDEEEVGALGPFH